MKLCDWIKTSKFTRPHGDKLESYVPKEDEASPPELYVCKEGIAQVFKEEDPAILHQMSTFWPWNMIKKVYEKEDKMIFSGGIFKGSIIFLFASLVAKTSFAPFPAISPGRFLG